LTVAVQIFADACQSVLAMNDSNPNTSGWTSEDLATIDAVDELRIASRRHDGTLRNPVTIWAVRDGAAVYVRSVNGPSAAWFRGTRVRREGHISVGGVEKDVTFEDADHALDDRIDEAYRAKYHRYAASIVDSVKTSQARSTTIKLVPSSY
jgi:hypothetical protein